MYIKKNIYLLLMFLCFDAFSQNIQKENTIIKDERGINIHNIVQMSGYWFIAFRNNTNRILNINNSEILSELTYNKFILKRSYFTLKKNLNETFSVRYTMDLTVDKEGSDAGNVETRLKYLYVKATPNIDSKVFTGLWLEVGMVHQPWLDYEQKINTYRVQDNMFIERNKIFNSADFGVTIGGNIGPKMDKQFLKEVNGAMKGKWVSYMLGVYNGGGYASLERNANKVFAMRLSTRPLANILPQLQMSGYFNVGKGNSKEAPDFNQLLGFIAYTGKHLTLTAQYQTGEGDFKAKYINPEYKNKALKNSGYSFFAEYKIHKIPLAVWGRYDEFTVDEPSEKYNTTRIIGGITYKINNNLRLILNTEHNKKNDEYNEIYELNLEVSF